MTSLFGPITLGRLTLAPGSVLLWLLAGLLAGDLAGKVVRGRSLWLPGRYFAWIGRCGGGRARGEVLLRSRSPRTSSSGARWSSRLSAP